MSRITGLPRHRRVGKRDAARFSVRPVTVQETSRAPAEHVPQELPAELWEEIDRAAGLFQVLSSEGKQLRYEQGRGRVSVSLCDLDGNRLRSVPLIESLGDYDDPAVA